MPRKKTTVPEQNGQVTVMGSKSVNRKLRDFIRQTPFLIMLFPALLVVFLFNYLPIYGVLIAFQDFMPGDKILSSSTIWVGFDNFIRFFTGPQFWPLLKLICLGLQGQKSG